jgi:hypothetical protein
MIPEAAGSCFSGRPSRDMTAGLGNLHEPSEPAGLVSSASRSRSAARAASSGFGVWPMSARMSSKGREDGMDRLLTAQVATPIVEIRPQAKRVTQLARRRQPALFNLNAM